MHQLAATGEDTVAKALLLEQPHAVAAHHDCVLTRGMRVETPLQLDRFMCARFPKDTMASDGNVRRAGTGLCGVSRFGVE